MEFEVLGPLRVGLAGRPVPIGNARKRQLVLVTLLARPGQPVAIDTLVEAVWGDRPPASARSNLQLYVHQLRQALGGEQITVRGDGYAIDPGDRLDAIRFRGLAEAGADALDAGDPAGAEATLRAALDLWRGHAFAEFLDGRVVAEEADRLELLRLETYQRWAEAVLATGATPRLVAELTELCRHHPYRESLRALLMRALYQTGRQAEALAVFRETRALLVEQVGVEPGQPLRDLHEAMLRADQALLPAARGQGRAAAAAAAVRVPRQLPPDPPFFTGRAEVLRALDDTLAGRGSAARTTVIGGMAGVGKTTLAVHWAHRAAGEFPDGQLYVNLRGFDPDGRVMSAAEALAGLLDALGMPADRMPPALDAQSARYRSLLAGKRILLLLDNARDADQIRPLLPGTDTVMTVVTSRDQLSPLVALAGADPVTLPLPSTMEARELLSRRLGAGRTQAEPEAVEEIILACGRLPLALAVVAARAQQTGFPLSALAAELRAAGRLLDVLDAGDATSQVRAVFSWSYAALRPPAAALFRLLGLHPGPDIAVAAAASLAGRPPEQVSRLLADLARANLLTEPAPGRYAFHDLVRRYAADLAGRHDPEPARRAALDRLLDHYRRVAHAADRLLNPRREPMPLPLQAPARRTDAEPLDDGDAARAWLTAEAAVLLAAQRYAFDAGYDSHAWQLAWALDSFLGWRGRPHDRAASWRAAVSAARRLANPVAQACGSRHLAYAHIMLGRYDDAHADLRNALRLYTGLGDQVGEALTHHLIGYAWDRQGDLDRALHHGLRSLALYRAGGSKEGAARALNSVGWCHARKGHHTEAITYCQQALTLMVQMDDRYGQAGAWDSLGYALRGRGDYPQAIESYENALALSRDLGDRHHEAEVLTRLGDIHRAAGDRDAAAGRWREALEVLTELDHPDTGEVRAKLRDLDRPDDPDRPAAPSE